MWLLVLAVTCNILAVSKVSAHALNYSACNYYRDEDVLSETEELEDDVQIQQVETRLVRFRSYYCRHRPQDLRYFSNYNTSDCVVAAILLMLVA